MLSLLRGLADRHEVPALQATASAAWHESSDPACLVLLALAQARLGDQAGARQSLAELAPFEAGLDLDARVDLAAVHLATGRLAQAGDILRSALAAAPDHARALARLAECHRLQGDGDAAVALYKRSALAHPRAGVLLDLARLLLQLQRHADTQAVLDRMDAHWPAPPGDAAPHRLQWAALQLELWLATQQRGQADAWLDARREQMPPQDWCSLVQAHARQLLARDAQAEAEDLLRAALRHYPEQLLLYVQLAELALAQGRVPQASALLRRAIGLAEKQGQPTIPLWLELSAANLQEQRGVARNAATRAVELAAALQPRAGHTPAQLAHWRLEATLALANVEAAEQKYAQAEVLYQEVLAEEPDNVPALMALGHAQMQVGLLEQAIALFTRASAIDPVRGHAALISARRFPEDVATLERLEELARRPAPPGRTSHNLMFSLAAAWEKRGDPARAFALAEAANAANRKLLRYDARAHRQQCARIRHAFSRSLYEHRRGLGNPSTLPVFVVGMPRSGTTLVEQILAGHSRIHGAGELGLLPTAIAGLERWERRTGSGRHYPDCVDDISPQVAAGITERMLAELQAYAPEASHVVDKLPHNFENIGLIKLLFPNARIVSVQRDPRDIAISNFFTDFAARHAGMGFAYDLDWIGEQLADHHLLMRHWDALFPGEILGVRYEELIADPQAQARRMLEYIGVEWEPRVLDFQDLERPVKTASVWQVRQPIYHSSSARWRRYERWLAPLIAATNRPVRWDPIAMAALPEPGLLEAGVAAWRDNRLDEAETRFQQLLHHLPQHAAASFMLGLVWVRKGHLADGIARMEQALERCPWNTDWRNDLARARGLAGNEATA